MSAPTQEQLLYYQTHASDNRQASLWATMICCIIFPVTFVVLRFLARYRTRAALQTDDWLILISLLPMCGMSAAGIASIYNGSGKHIIFVKSIPLFVQLFISMVTTYCVAMTLAKLSVLTLYCRIFPSKDIKIISIVLSAVVISYCLALVLVGFLQCIPLDSMWTGQPGVCIEVGTPYLVLAIANVITDFLILMMPVRAVLGLRMKGARKIQVLGMFLLGGVVCVFGIIRAHAVATVSHTDQSWTAVDGTIWSLAEVAVAIVSANLPVLRPLFVKAANLTRTGQSGYQSGSNNSSKKKSGADWSGVRSAWSTGANNASKLDFDERPFVKVPDTHASSLAEDTELRDIRVETGLHQYSHAR